MSKQVAVALVVLAVPATAWCSPPRIGGINPPAVQRGVGGRLQFFGKEIGPEAELILPFDAEWKSEGGGKEAVNIFVKPSSDTRPGAYPVRIRTPDGISNLRLLVVTDLPVVRVKEPNGGYRDGSIDPNLTQPISIPCIIAGNRLERDIDAFQFTVNEGDRLTFVTQTWQAGLTPDPLLRLRNGGGKIIAYAHDTQSLQRDERIDFTFQSTGRHFLELQSTGGGGWNNHYLVRIGPNDYVRTIFPLGGRRGEKVTFQTVNRDGKVGTVEATIPVDPWCDHWRLPLPEQFASLPWLLASGDYPEYFEESRGDEPQPIAWPATINGRIGQPGERDLYRIAVVPGQTVRVRVEAFHLGSALDGYLMVYDPVGKTLLAKHDDQGYRGLPDPGLDFEAPPGLEEVVVAVCDTLNRGGLEYAYRLTVEAGGPDFFLWFGNKQNPTNEEDVGWHRMDASDTLNLTVGQETKLRLSVRRNAKEDDPHYNGPLQGYAGPITIQAHNLPAGVSAAPLVIAAGETTAELIFTATADAPRLPFEIVVTGEGTRPDGTVVRRIAERRLYLSDPAVTNMPWNWRVQKVTCVTTQSAATATAGR